MGGALPLLGSVLAVAGLVGLAWGLGFTAKGQIFEGTARRLADGLPHGFSAQALAFDATGTSALLTDGHGRLALIAPKGVHHVALEIDGAWRLCADSSSGLVLFGPGGRHAFVLGDDVQTWRDAITLRDQGHG